MTWIVDHWLQLLFLTAYLLVLAWHAWEGKRRTSSLADYLVAGRGLGGWVIALSFYATFMSTNTFIGAAGKSWDFGLIWCLGVVVYAALCYTAWYLVAPRFVPLTKKYGSLTIPDFLGYHYNSLGLRRLAAVVVVFSSIIYLLAVYKGSALALALVLDLRYDLSLLLIFAVVTSYTLAGGFQSVVLTDAVQGLLMVIGAMALLIALIVTGGGISAVLESLSDPSPGSIAWQGPKARLSTTLGLALALGIKFMVEPRQLSRFYGLRDQSALRLAAFVAPLLIIVTYISLLPVGALAHLRIPLEKITDTDEVVPYLLGQTQVFGPVLGSLFLLVLASAAMSSLDSVLLVAASSVDHDLLMPGLDDSRAVARTRVWVVIISLASMTAALNQKLDIVSVTAFSGSLYGACFLPSLVIGLYWQRRSSRAAITSILLGSTSVIAWYIARKSEWTSWHEVYVGLIVGLAVYVGVSMLSRRDSGSIRH